MQDNLGVEIAPTDTVMVTAWGDGARLYDTGTKSKVVRLNRRRVVITDKDGFERAVTTSEVQVLRRDGEPGFEGNAPKRCTCGALDYAICNCNINLRDFMATGSGRRA